LLTDLLVFGDVLAPERRVARAVEIDERALDLYRSLNGKFAGNRYDVAHSVALTFTNGGREQQAEALPRDAVLQADRDAAKTPWPNILRIRPRRCASPAGPIREAEQILRPVLGELRGEQPAANVLLIAACA